MHSSGLPFPGLLCLIECFDLEGVVLVDEFGGEQLLDLQSETTGDSQQDLERDVRGG